ncbi:LysR family transcriptional regulator [Agrobacterium tumefaciens]|uniref:LysR family transcriptional regulator n=1 Tax=Agrobacterium tumefaciens TaxID=358 RepID=UPI0021D15450|nr:LysR family transcriptional regulator [Agrobacterium tumefaciens]UXS01338.1 LysR family transcriptional regulator [Agrobacterium tumefaciens]
MDKLSEIEAFVRVAERLNFAKAGQSLGLSPSAIGKSVARLESSLGVRLFNRTTRQVTLTDEGTMLFERYSAILTDLRDTHDAVKDNKAAPSGSLRVTLPTIGYRFLLPILPEFRRLYPDIDLEFDFNDRRVDLIEGGFDAAIRSGALDDSSLMMRRLGPFRFVVCGAPDYFARMGRPQQPGQLLHHDALRFRFPSSGRFQDWRLENGDNALAGMRVALTCGNMEAIRAAAIDGLGLGYMPEFLAKDAIRDGLLESVLNEYLAAPGHFSILWPATRFMTPRLRAFIDFASENMFRDT